MISGKCGKKTNDMFIIVFYKAELELWTKDKKKVCV